MFKSGQKMQVAIEELKIQSELINERMTQLSDQIDQRVHVRLKELQREIDLNKKKIDSLEQRLHDIEMLMVSKGEFRNVQLSVQQTKGLKSHVKDLNRTSTEHRRKTEEDLHRLKESSKHQMKHFDSLTEGHKRLRGSVVTLKDTVSVIDKSAKKAFNELDSLYDQDHRTQTQLNEMESRIKKIVDVLHREETDHESKLALKLEMVEREVTKLFKFLCLIIFAVGLITFLCVWSQYSRRPTRFNSFRAHQL